MTICKNCGEETNNPKYCSRSCAATVNNKKYPKLDASKNRFCPDCGGIKAYKAKRCQTCYRKHRLEKQLERTLSDVAISTSWEGKWSTLRQIAQRVMEFSGRENKCQKCGFDIVTQICHIKPVSEFSKDTLVSVVNSEDNLVYLCPNHHVMFDRGLIEL